MPKLKYNDGTGFKQIVPSMDEFSEHKAELVSHLADDTHIPKGLISMWSGSIEAIPTGWALCNGENGTPDLRDRFIVGVGGDYEIGDTGGLDSVTLTLSQLPSHSHGSGTLSTSSAGSHSHGSGTLSTNTTGSHTHTYTSHKNSLGAEGTKENKVNLGSHSFSTSSSGSHNHSISGSTASAGSHSHSVTGSTSTAGGGSSHENRPPYYALAFIMKL